MRRSTTPKSLLLLAVLTLLSSSTQAQAQADEFSRSTSIARSGEGWRVKGELPPAFPTPRRPVSASFSCEKGTWETDAPALWQEWTTKYKDKVVVTSNSLSYNGSTWSCQDKRVILKEETDSRAAIRLQAITTEIVSEGCDYPNIRQDCWTTFGYITLKNGQVVGEEMTFGTKYSRIIYAPTVKGVIAVRQNGKLQPVVFERQNTPVKYDPTAKLEVFFKPDKSTTWTYVTFDPVARTFQWIKDVTTAPF